MNRHIENNRCGFGLDSASMPNPNDTKIDGPGRYYLRRGAEVILKCNVASCPAKEIIEKIGRTVLGNSEEAVRKNVIEESISNPTSKLYRAVSIVRLHCPKYKIVLGKTG